MKIKFSVKGHKGMDAEGTFEFSMKDYAEAAKLWVNDPKLMTYTVNAARMAQEILPELESIITNPEKANEIISPILDKFITSLEPLTHEAK